MFTPTSGFLLDTAARAMAAALAKPSPEKVGSALDEVFAQAELSWEATRTSTAFRLGMPAMACKAGCGWCCHQQVGVSVPEAIRIAIHLRALPGDEGEALAERVRDADDKTNGLTTSQRSAAKLPCAFLVDGSCSIYGVRPLRCRGLISTDESFCHASFSDPAAVKAGLELGTLRPVFLGAPQHVHDQALNGVLKALHFARLADYGLELHAAVRELLDQPKRMATWLKQRTAPKTAALVPDPGADLRAQFR